MTIRIEEIAKAHELLKAGALTETEFESVKAGLLAESETEQVVMAESTSTTLVDDTHRAPRETVFSSVAAGSDSAGAGSATKWLGGLLIAAGFLTAWVYISVPWVTDGLGGEESYTLPSFAQNVSSYGLLDRFAALAPLRFIGLFVLISLVVSACGMVLVRRPSQSASIIAAAAGIAGLLLLFMVYAATKTADFNSMMVAGSAPLAMAALLTAPVALGFIAMHMRQAGPGAIPKGGDDV